MRVSKTTMSFAAAAFLISAPVAFAQSAGTSMTGTSNGVQGTPPSAATTMAPSDSTMGRSDSMSNTSAVGAGSLTSKSPLAPTDNSIEKGQTPSTNNH